MTADSFDNFDYERASEHTSEARRKHYWAVAIGLQAVDGLEVSDYLSEVAQSYISGEKSLAKVGELVRAHHSEGHGDKWCAHFSQQFPRPGVLGAPKAFPKEVCALIAQGG